MTNDRYTNTAVPYVPPTVTKVCDNTSVGVLIYEGNDSGRLLTIRRVKAPAGRAPVAGHVDSHGSPREAAHTEAHEEVGLTISNSTLVWKGWMPNVCPRQHGPAGPGHEWTVFRATRFTGEVQTAPDETSEPRWLNRVTLRLLVDRTIDYADGLVTAEKFLAVPGLEPVWVTILHRIGVISVSDDALAGMERLMTAGCWPEPA